MFPRVPKKGQSERIKASVIAKIGLNPTDAIGHKYDDSEIYRELSIN